MTKISSIVCGFLILPLFLQAQPSGNIRGVVTDGASGQALPYVSVIVLHSNPVVGTTTDEAGNFRLKNLPGLLFPGRLVATGFGCVGKQYGNAAELVMSVFYWYM